MSLGERLFAAMYNRFTAKTEKACFSAHRQALLASVRGDVLEIGAGTGANLSHYGDGLATLTLTEPSKPMIRRLERRRDKLAPAAKVLRAPAEDLPFEDDSFDVRGVHARALRRGRSAPRPQRAAPGPQAGRRAHLHGAHPLR